MREISLDGTIYSFLADQKANEYRTYLIFMAA